MTSTDTLHKTKTGMRFDPFKHGTEFNLINEQLVSCTIIEYREHCQPRPVIHIFGDGMNIQDAQKDAFRRAKDFMEQGVFTDSNVESTIARLPQVEY